MNEITKKLSKNKNYKLTEEEKTQVDLLDKSLTSNNRFQLYKQLYNKTYPTKTEETIASNNLKKSLIEINKVNSSDAPYKLGFTKFSDLSDEEFYTNYVGILINDEESSTISKDTLQKNIQDDSTCSKFLQPQSTLYKTAELLYCMKISQFRDRVRKTAKLKCRKFHCILISRSKRNRLFRDIL